MRFLFFILLCLSLQNFVNSIMKLDGPISKPLVDYLHDEFITHANETEWLIYFNTNGGSVSEGNRLLPFFQSHNMTCIADRAISMGFFLFQQCQNRIMLPYGVLMQHDMSILLMDELPKVHSYMRFLSELEDNMVKLQTDRINITTESFKEKIRDDWWMNATQAVENNCADSIIPSITYLLQPPTEE